MEEILKVHNFVDNLSIFTSPNSSSNIFYIENSYANPIFFAIIVTV